MALKSALRKVISICRGTRASLSFCVSAIWKGFDIKPVFFLGGLSATGYGLYLNFSLGTALIFVGIVFMALGYLMGGKR